MACKNTPYLKLDPEIEAAIRENRDKGWRNPQAFKDSDVLRREPNPHDEATITRSAFARDIEKIINTPAYNRYADKTQVFSFVENDDICRRGLHVQLVSRISRGIVLPNAPGPESLISRTPREPKILSSSSGMNV